MNTTSRPGVDPNPETEGYWTQLAPRSPEVPEAKAFDWLKACHPDDSVHWIFGSLRNLDRPLVDARPREVLLGVRSFDHACINGIRRLSEELNKAFEPDVDDDGFVGSNGVHKSFDALRTVSGYCSTPADIAVTDNSAEVDALGLPSDFKTQRHKEIFDELFRLVFSRYKPEPIKVPKLSTAGFPTGTSDPAFKARVAKWQLANPEHALSRIGRRDLHSLARDCGIIRCYKHQKRLQSDQPGKVRKVATLEYALTGGRRGSMVETNKKVVLPDGTHVEDFSAMRVRLIHGAPWLANIMLQVISTGVMYAMFDWAGPTFHHTNMNAIARKIELAGDAVFSDISNYDRSMASFIVRRACEVAKEYVDERICDWSYLMFTAPFFSQPVSYKLDERGNSVADGRPIMVGDIYDPSTSIFSGNRSGHAWTSLMAKTVKVWDTLCVIDDLMGDVLGNIESYLRHERALKIVNNGDDEGLIGPRELIEKYRKYRFGRTNPGYFVAEPEVGQVFSGFMFMREATGKVKAVPRIHTAFERIYVPERSIGGNFRPFWPIGIEARLTSDIALDDFTPNPSMGAALDIHAKVWRDHFAPTYGSLFDILTEGKASMPIQVSMYGKTRIDLEVLEDPDKLRYKYTDKDVSPSVLQLIEGANIGFQQIEAFVKTYYKGNLL